MSEASLPAQRWRPAAHRLAPVVIFTALALLPLAASLSGNSHWLGLMTRVMALALAALSLDFILGIGGLVSFGHAAYIGLGGYVGGILAQHGLGDMLLSLPVTLLVTGLFAALTGAVCLRTKGVAFIMITLAFGQMAYFLAQALYAYGGDDGLTLAARATVAGLPLLAGRVAFYYIVLAALGLAFLLLRRIAASRFGRALQGARDNGERMASLGYDVFRIRLAAYVIAGMMAGVAGLLLANHTLFISPATMAWQRSGELIFMVIIGGLGSLWGAILGAGAFLLIEESLSGLTENWKALFGLLIMLFVLFARGGLTGLAARLFSREARHG